MKELSKVKRVIDSCSTLPQLTSAAKYTFLFLKKYNFPEKVTETLTDYLKQKGLEVI